MEIAVLIILIALLQYIAFTAITGFSRVKYNVPAPKTVGDETWERLYRIQQNTLEQLIIFIPAVLAFSWLVSHQWVALPGAIFILGRQLYFHTYKADPEKRAIGVALSLLSNFTLVAVSLVTVLIAIIA